MWRPDDARKHQLLQTRWPSVEEARSALLFQPMNVGGVTLQTRTWVPAMVPWRATEEGKVTKDLLEWYCGRVRTWPARERLSWRRRVYGTSRVGHSYGSVTIDSSPACVNSLPGFARRVAAKPVSSSS